MRASACIARVGGLALALGVGAAVAAGATGAASASPGRDPVSDRDSVARASAAGPARVSQRPHGAGVARSTRAAAAAGVRVAGPVAVSDRRPDTSAPMPRIQRPLASESAAEPTGPALSTAISAGVGAVQSVPTEVGVAHTAGATGVDPIGALLLNRTPSQSSSQTGQGPTGVITGIIEVTDPDSDVFTFTVDTGPAHGSVQIDSSGQFVYTPDPAAARLGVTDTFSVSVSDAPSGFHVHGLGGLINLLTFGLIGTSGHTVTRTVSVRVEPVNTAPTATVAVGPPDPATGVILGRVEAADADGDPLSYASSGGTAKGTFTLGDDGSFTYVPTEAARHEAAALGADDTDRVEAVLVTVSDGYGGSTPVSVSMTVLPANAAPTGSVSVGAPDPVTGLVAGAVLGADPDGDTLLFTGSTTTDKGTVLVDPDGSFIYSPTADARHAAAALTAGSAERTDAFTVTIADGYGASVPVPVSVAIAAANTAPVAVASAGLPDPLTGLVAGAVLGVDADGDALSYGTTRAPTKGSVVVAADGGFSYTPTALARHLAAGTDASADDAVDTFIVTVADGHGGSVDVPVTVTVSPAAVTFDFAYGTGSQHWSPAARTALESAASRLAAHIVVDAPVTVSYDVIGEDTVESGWLATAFVNFSSAGPGYHGTVVQTKILTGTDANGAAADSRLTVNFAYPWALGDSVTGNRYDFQSVVMHELVHTLGFITGFGTDPASIDRNWTSYDSFLTTAEGLSPIGGGYLWDAAYIPNITGGGGGLYFTGPNAVSAYGGPVPIYTPRTWTPGSSLSHLDPAGAPPGTVYLMDPSDGYGPGVRAITPVEIGVLTDLGYTIHALAFVGFGVLCRRRR